MISPTKRSGHARWALRLLWAAALTGRRTLVQGPRVLAVAITFAAVGLFVLTYDHWHDVDDVAVVLATLTLMCAFVRAAMTFGDLKALAHGRDLLVEHEVILNAAGEGIMGTDAYGTFTFANPAAMRMIGYGPEELVACDLHDLLHHTKPDGSPNPRSECPVLTSLADGSVHRTDNDIYWRKDGTFFAVDYTSTPIVDGHRTTGAVVVFRDVTDRREIERVKDEFTSVVSHELRTPLTSIRASLGLLESGAAGPLPDTGRRMVVIAVKNADRLVRLIDDILDVGRVDAGSMHLRRAPCDGADLVARAIAAVAPTAGTGAVTITAVAEPAPFECDADRLVQTLTNLIDNAVKFSSPGDTVRVRCERRDAEVRFTVRDTGRGIPAERLETIFERFEQVDSSYSRQKGGTGLGLAICRSIVERHGGTIWAQSTVDRGSTLSFVIPAKPITRAELDRRVLASPGAIHTTSNTESSHEPEAHPVGR